MYGLSVDGAIEALRPLVVFAVGIAVYGIFIFHFYRFLARKDIFRLNLQQYSQSSFGFLKKFLRFVFYVIEYVLLFPIFTFFWFSVLTIILSFLAKEQAVSNILLVSMAVVLAVRITAYYTEDLSRDLAKMLPFALLGVYIVDVSYFTFANSIDMLKQIPSLWQTLVYYLALVFFLETALRFGYVLSGRSKKDKEKIKVEE